MPKYKVISYRNINSDGRTKTNEKIITAGSIIGAKQQASMLFFTKGRWIENDKGEHVKSTSQIIGGDMLFVVPNNSISALLNKLRTHFIEQLGWDNYQHEFVIDNTKVFCLAKKRGYCVYLCDKNKVKDQSEFHEKLKYRVYENIVVFASEDRWRWQLIITNHDLSKSIKRIDVPVGAVPDIKFELSEESEIYLTDVCRRVENVFDRKHGGKLFSQIEE